MAFPTSGLRAATQLSESEWRKWLRGTVAARTLTGTASGTPASDGQVMNGAWAPIRRYYLRTCNTIDSLA